MICLDDLAVNVCLCIWDISQFLGKAHILRRYRQCFWGLSQFLSKAHILRRYRMVFVWLPGNRKDCKFMCSNSLLLIYMSL